MRGAWGDNNPSSAIAGQGLKGTKTSKISASPFIGNPSH
jgi:hypothetical protein